MGGQAIEAKRINTFLLNPEFIGIITDEKHPLFDPRSNLPLDEGMIASIMAFGVKEPILAFKDGDKCVVIDGIQRVRNAIEANKRLAKDGKELVTVRTILEKGPEVDLFGIKVLTNECRQDDPPIAKAEKLQRYMAMGRTEEQAAVVFGWKVSSVKAHLALLDLAKPVQRAVTDGELSVTAAAHLSGLDREKQIEAMHGAKKPGKKTTVKAAKKAVKKSKGTAEAEDCAPGKREIKALFTSEMFEPDSDVMHTLLWVLYGDRKGVVGAALKKLEAKQEEEAA